jgi:hypothetical protein
VTAGKGGTGRTNSKTVVPVSGTVGPNPTLSAIIRQPGIGLRITW